MIELTEEAIQNYLDNAIRTWRDKRDNLDPLDDAYEMVLHYIDAFQSVRTSLLGETLDP